MLGLDESKQKIRQNSNSMTKRLHRSAEIVLNGAKLMTVRVKIVLQTQNQTTNAPKAKSCKVVVIYLSIYHDVLTCFQLRQSGSKKYRGCEMMS